MKNLNDLLKELTKSTTKNTFDANGSLLTILKSGSKSREELKLEMLKIRIKDFYGTLEVDFENQEIVEKIKKLSVTSRNSIDTLISKNNSNFLFENYIGYEKTKIELINNKYSLSK